MKLIVDTEYRGHHSEYLDNLINNPLAKDQFFLLHPQYVQSKSLKFRDKIVYYEYEPKKSYLNKLIELRFINKILKRHKIDECLLLNFNYYYFILLFFRINVNNLSAIYYLPHFFSNNLNQIKKFLKNINFWFIQNKFNLTIFLLNDPIGVDKLNKIGFKANFKLLSDPVVKIKPFCKSKINTVKNFIFIGEISERKGINILLEMLETLSTNNQPFTFTIAGNAPTKKNEIVNRISSVKKINPTLIQYCNLSRLSDMLFDELLSFSDVVLCLHQVTDGSSGIVGKAILHGKVVIGPNQGLISRLISENKLGINTDVTNPSCVINSMQKYLKNEDDYEIDISIRDNYLKKHSTENFVKDLLDV